MNIGTKHNINEQLLVLSFSEIIISIFAELI